MTKDPQVHVDPPQEDEIDLVEIIKFLWDSRRTILIITAVFIGIGLFVALLSTPQYRVETRILPEIQQRGGGSSDLLRQLAGRTGIQISSGNYEALRPDLYPRVLSSTPFFYDLLDEEIRVSTLDEPVTVQTYVEEHMRGNPVLGAARRYTIGLPRTILGLMRSAARKKEEPGTLDTASLGVPQLSSAEYNAIGALSGRIESDMDMQAWIITVSVEFPDPLAAAYIAELTVNYLSDYVIEYKTEKSQKDLQFIEDRYEEKQARFFEAQQRLARFQDANRNIVSAAVQTEEQRLQHQYTLAFSLYNELAQRREDARIRVQEETPVVKMLEPVKVPRERSQPKRARIIVMYTLVGGVIGVGFVFGRREYFKLREKLAADDRHV
jgi:uncharacterized protein involved in exopolysaccharide biosynthesis